MRRIKLLEKLLLSLLFAAACVGSASAATGSITIGGIQVVADLGTDGSGTGWTWTASTATLTLSGTITGNIDIVNTAGDVTVTVPSAVTLSGQLRLGTGNLTISGGGKLTVDYYSDNVGNKGAIDVRAGGLEIAGLTVDVTNTGERQNHQGIWTSGDFRMASGSLVTTTARGVGVHSETGSIYVSGTASLVNTEIEFGVYNGGNGLLRAPGGSINISGGTVTGGVTGGTTMGALVGIINITGGTVNMTRGGIWGGDVTVSGATTVVRIEGDILATGPTGTAPAYTGSLTVSGGTVTVNGRLDNTTPTVAGMITVTGGNVTIDGVEIEPGTVNSESALIAALRSTTPLTIKLGADITLTTANVQMGASHTLNIPAGRILSIPSPGYIDINGHSLSIEGDGTADNIKINGTAAGSTLNITGITINLTRYLSFMVNTVNVNGGTVNLSSPDANQIIYLRDNAASLNINGGTVDVQNFKGSGIENVGGLIHLNGGTLKLHPGANGWAINNDAGGTLKYTSGTLTGADGAIIQLTEGVTVEGMAGKFNDRGTDLTTNSRVMVGLRDATPSASDLSGGKYVWNGSAFTKTGIIISAQPQDVDVPVGEIDESLTVAATASNDEAVSYQWHTFDLYDWPPEQEIAGETNGSYAIPTDHAIGTYQYVCKITAAGCDDVWTRHVTVRVVSVTYPVTIGATTNGSLSASPTNAAEDEKVTLTITPATGYELGSISAYRTGSPSAPVVLSGSGATRIFTMPAHGVTVEATFEKSQATLDAEAVEAAKTVIEEATYMVGQAIANTEEAVKAWLAEAIGTLLGTTGVNAGDITIVNFEAAEYGTNGSFDFTVALSKGDEAGSAVASGTISATSVTLAITVQPASATAVVEGSIEGSLTVEAESVAPLSYQWHTNTSNSNEGGTAIEGATAAEFVLPTDLAPGTHYYYVVMMAQGTEPIASNVAVVTVSPAPAVPLFMGLADEYAVGAPAVPLRSMGIGSSALTTFSVNGVVATEFNPSETGIYLIEASSDDGKLKIWKYIKVK